ncbi:hypothetical protein SCHPADRAFT_825313 [Schizopora paradoxa]|uniref:Microbial-type PARG catalytic domain-containing protein n=1 Tax=Schizopora paradoxa TaxID=27342 RepID=A0A0H2RU31_9AGAM|nr:hypothetical protein SCHPADRAFT_825313 [Schizopora paradoxa]
MFKKERNQVENARKQALMDIAETTLNAIDRGSFILEDVGEIYLTESITRSVENTRMYGPESVLAEWTTRSGPRNSSLSHQTSSAAERRKEAEERAANLKKKECKTIVLHTSTLAGARLLASTTSKDSAGKAHGPSGVELEREENMIGVLSFADAKKRGGGFLNGVSAQEESIARSSTLYPSLSCPAAESFYNLHLHDPRAGYYSHSMIYSPNVLFLRDDDGNWQKPICVEVLTAAAVNASVVKQSIMGRLAPKSEAAKIDKAMRERAARALYAFERHGVRHLVLGAWGCGASQIDVKMIAGIWADLLGKEGSRFRYCFDRVIFAIPELEMFKAFEKAFESRCVGDGLYVETASMLSSTSV